MVIGDSYFQQLFTQLLLIEVRESSGDRISTNVDERLDVVSKDELLELCGSSRRVSNGPNRDCFGARSRTLSATEN
ncbi:MAG TPA: hypothetical protein VF251_07875 [Pyrinomonadaceae bacterium]